jgi:hypothetical protein
MILHRLVRPSLYFKPERMPWREDMTLCIAAETTYATKNGSTSVVIVASDKSTETETSKAEIEDKLVVLAGKWPILFAGTLNRAAELIDTYEKYFAKNPPTAENIMEVVKKPVIIQKRKLANEYVGARLGMTYAEFLERGQSHLPPAIYREMISDIARMTLECSLILVQFVANKTYLFRVHEDGLVERCMHFCAVGSGLTIAESALFHREHNVWVSLELGLYNIYEAMRLGSGAPGVGEKFSISTFAFSPNGLQWLCMNLHYAEYLEGRYQQFGPRTVTGIEFKSSGLQPFMQIPKTPKGKKK